MSIRKKKASTFITRCTIIIRSLTAEEDEVLYRKSHEDQLRYAVLYGKFELYRRP